MNRFIARFGWVLLALSLVIGAIVYMRDPGFYPGLRVQTGAGVDLVFLNRSRSTLQECEMTLSRIERSNRAQCPTCVTRWRQCWRQLPAEQAAYFTDAPLSYPSAHLPSGVMIFESPDIAAAQQACDSTVDIMNLSRKYGLSQCFAANTERPFFKVTPEWVDLGQLLFALLGLTLALLAARFVSFLVIRYETLHARYSHDMLDAGPQKFHAFPTPRVGGVPLMAGLLVCATLLLSLPNRFSDQEFGLLILASLPAFIGGLSEDLTKRVGVSQRLLLTMLSGLFGCWLMDATLTRLDLPWVDDALRFMPLAVALTVFAVSGVANSINIIDGYNGLAAGYGVIASAALAFVAARHGDSMLLFANLVMAGALLGFMIWNWPAGKIFLGDGGAYLLGFWLAEMNVLLVVRNASVSAWFPLAVMVYPVFETLFTIYRRRVRQKMSPGLPDSKHLHQLVYKRLVRVNVGASDPALKNRRNSLVAPYLWVFSGMAAVIAIPFASNTFALQIICLVFCLFYILLYGRLSGWRVPRVLVLKRGPQARSK